MRALYFYLLKVLLYPLLKIEQQKNFGLNERPVEYVFALNYIQKLCTGKILDVGTGQSSWPHLIYSCGYHVTAIDKIKGYWSSFLNRHFKVINEDILYPKLKEKFQMITCISVLEHILHYDLAVKNMCKLLEPDGYLIMTFPFNENKYHDNIYNHKDVNIKAHFISQVFNRETINQIITENPLKIIDQEYFQIFTGELWGMGNRINPSKKVNIGDIHNLTCILFQKI